MPSKTVKKKASKTKEKKPKKKVEAVEEIEEVEEARTEHFRIRDLETLLEVTELLEKAVRGDITVRELSKHLTRYRSA